REPAEGAAEALARLEELVEQELAAARPAAGGDAHEVAPSRVASPCSSSRSWLATWARAEGAAGRLARGSGGGWGGAPAPAHGRSHSSWNRSRMRMTGQSVLGLALRSRVRPKPP